MEITAYLRKCFENKNWLTCMSFFAASRLRMTKPSKFLNFKTLSNGVYLIEPGWQMDLCDKDRSYTVREKEV
jgi:hypothetical protein